MKKIALIAISMVAVATMMLGSLMIFSNTTANADGLQQKCVMLFTKYTPGYTTNCVAAGDSRYYISGADGGYIKCIRPGYPIARGCKYGW
ncbi:MAG: hypothetical protein WCJ58_04255 [bacterium]